MAALHRSIGGKAALWSTALYYRVVLVGALLRLLEEAGITIATTYVLNITSMREHAKRCVLNIEALHRLVLKEKATMMWVVEHTMV